MTQALLAQWGANIRAARTAKQITRGDLARYCNVAPTTTWRWEQGHREPGLQHKAMIGELLEVDPAVLFPFTPETVAS